MLAGKEKEMESFVLSSLEDGIDLEAIGYALEDYAGVPVGRGYDIAWGIAYSAGLVNDKEDL